MKKLFSTLFVALLALTSCSGGGEEILPPPVVAAPVITLDSPTSIYETKVGRSIVIAPRYQNTNQQTTYRWTLNGSVIGSGASLNFVNETAGRYYITLAVENEGGKAEKELRVDVLELAKPTVTIAGSEDGYKVVQGSELILTAVVSSIYDAVTYSWKINGTEVSKELNCQVPTDEKGTYDVAFSANNEDGTTEVSFKVEVCGTDEIPFQWEFEKKTYNLSTGRKIRLLPVVVENAADAVYTWYVNGEQAQSSSSYVFIFDRTEVGQYAVKVEAKTSSVIISKTLTVNVCAAEGTYRRSVSSSSQAKTNKVYEFLPAPGQFVNEKYTANTMDEACAYAEGRLAQEAYVSLGTFGGYLVVGFDHSIDNDGDYNIAITGNAYDGNSEPGIVWVMQDENGDGLPNDTWYELKGSEYGKTETIQDYAVTYYRPRTTGSPVSWTDNYGQSGTVDYLGAYHTQDYYYPAWVEADSYTLRGTRLKERNYDKSGNGTYWVNDNYDWGYADNFSKIDRLTDDDNYNAGASDNHFKISDAVTFDGQPANLKYVDFVKIQTGVLAKSGWIGEVSTEVFGVKDFNILK